MSTPRKPSAAAASRNLAKEMERVGNALGKGKPGGPERLALLRRQAELGDLRDAVRERERRAADTR